MTDVSGLPPASDEDTIYVTKICLYVIHPLTDGRFGVLIRLHDIDNEHHEGVNEVDTFEDAVQLLREASQMLGTEVEKVPA
jgi:hypothetical protein